MATAAEYSSRYRVRRRDDEIVPRSRCRRDSPNSGDFVLATAAFMIVAMWIFPEVAEKSKCRKKIAGENSATPVIKARHYCCSAECLLLAQSGHRRRRERCPLSGLKRTLASVPHRHAFLGGSRWVSNWRAGFPRLPHDSRFEHATKPHSK
jgi:hypothetical protein